MRLLFIGELAFGQTSLMRLRAFERLGFVTRGIDTIEPWFQVGWAARQLQRRLEIGPAINKINRIVLEAAAEFAPSLVWAEKQEFLRLETVVRLKRLGARVVHFTPDPYFSVPWKRTRIMDAALKGFDVLAYCKAYEKLEYEAIGPEVVYMPLGYCDQIHRTIRTSDPRWLSTVGFVGGWEPRRERLLGALVETGVDVKIWGKYWDLLKNGRPGLRRSIILNRLSARDAFPRGYQRSISPALRGGEVYGDDYARAVSGARIGIGFLRKAWPDQHTTRTFEIPACGSMLLADRTDEHMRFFEEGTEAEFFDTKEELIDKVRFYTANEPARALIAEAGQARTEKSRYAYVHRITDMLAELGIAI
jgi:spore maturation protein CgeB